MTPRLLLTGPVHGREPYAEAARGAGWEAVDWPLLEVSARRIDPQLVELDPPDWVAVTSSNALAALTELREALAEVPFACVGERTAERLAAFGFRVALEPAESAAALVERLLVAVDPPARAATRVLWPRGSVSSEFGERLATGGVGVVAPVAYETRAHVRDDPLPEADAVFLASPSAVRRYAELVRFVDRAGPRAVAIGATTLAAIERGAAEHFRSAAALSQPEPAALAEWLRALPAD